jgi:hypothetical protein
MARWPQLRQAYAEHLWRPERRRPQPSPVETDVSTPVGALTWLGRNDDADELFEVDVTPKRVDPFGVSGQHRGPAIVEGERRLGARPACVDGTTTAPAAMTAQKHVNHSILFLHCECYAVAGRTPRRSRRA